MPGDFQLEGLAFFGRAAQSRHAGASETPSSVASCACRLAAVPDGARVETWEIMLSSAVPGSAALGHLD